MPQQGSSCTEGTRSCGPSTCRGRVDRRHAHRWWSLVDAGACSTGYTRNPLGSEPVAHCWNWSLGVATLHLKIVVKSMISTMDIS
ncbi:hypothetical protein DPMN_116732 [Dreissena polymorpha]|uniref:Uncharacterized protein n=1 Tax=Dreissena polymorpha TaxID=45954 RepID=A0A9D4KQD1_DREPO|nr:hypothetical protein DPMN_116732 [Dreissena polymorpha]